MDLREFKEWVRQKAPKLRLDPVHLRSFSSLCQPQANWPVVVTSSVAYSSIHARLPGRLRGGTRAIEDSTLELRLFPTTCQMWGPRKPFSHFLLTGACGPAIPAGSRLCDGLGAIEDGHHPLHSTVL